MSRGVVCYNRPERYISNACSGRQRAKGRDRQPGPPVSPSKLTSRVPANWTRIIDNSPVKGLIGAHLGSSANPNITNHLDDMKFICWVFSSRSRVPIGQAVASWSRGRFKDEDAGLNFHQTRAKYSCTNCPRSFSRGSNLQRPNGLERRVRLGLQWVSNSVLLYPCEYGTGPHPAISHSEASY